MPEVAQQFTQELQVRLNRKKHMTGFLKGFRKLESTNLRHVSLHINMVKSWGKEFPVLKKLAVQSTLTSFQFHYEYSTRCSSRSHLAIRPFLQIWLDSAPNLTVLKIQANFYPDLKGCKSIKVFEFKFIKISLYNARGALNLTEVTGMLTQIKDSVVEVKLDAICDSYRQVKIITTQKMRRDPWNI